MKRPDILKDLLTRLDQGEWQRGDLLPPLRSLADHYGTNHQTVANALASLALLGRVHTTPRGSRVLVGERRELHLGQYRALVPGQKPTGTADWKSREGDTADESGTTVESGAANTAAAELLRVPEGSDLVVRHRVRSVHGVPVQYKRTLLPMEMARLTPPEGGKPPMLSASSPRVPDGLSIAQWLGMGVARVEYRCALAQADAEDARALQVAEDVPVMRAVSRGLRTDGSVAFATVTTTPGNTEVVMCIETDEVRPTP